MKKINKFIGKKIRAIVGAAVIVGLLASFAVRQSNTAAAQTAENESANLSPQATNLVFSNLAPIAINDNAPASPYPSSIFVSGVNPATVTRVQVRLVFFTHTFPDDVDIVLVAPDGRRTVLMSDAGGDADVSNINLTFSAAATTVLPDSSPPALVGGTYRPANYNAPFPDTFPAPFPAPNTLTDAPADLSVFNLTNPNGQWNLYVVDDAGGDFGSIGGGWDLVLTVPQVFTVNSTADTTDGTCDAANCTLREAITAAASDDLINFSPLFDTPQVININSQLLIIKNLSIAGKGANLLTIRNVAAGNSRVIVIDFSITAELSGMTVTGGTTTGGGGGIFNLGTLTLRFVHITGNTASFGGGIYNAIFDSGSLATLNVISSTVSNNTANWVSGGTSGGIDNFGTLTVTNSTISGNRVLNGSSNGGGINSSGNNNSSVTITNSTITDNEAAGANSAGGVFKSSTTATVRNSIIAANRNNSTTPDVNANGGVFVSQGFNLIGNRGTVTNFTATGDQSGTGAGNQLDPLLAPLALYGGTTPTHGIQSAASPALDKGNSSGFSTDQRGFGFNRPIDLPTANATGGDGADIGAFEAQSTPTTVSGRVTYVNAPTTTGVPFTTLNAAGSIPLSTTTDANGFYSMTAFGSGAYTITPSKPNQINGISNLDASTVARHVAGLITLDTNKQIAADTSGNGAISSLDAAFIAQFVASIANPSITGTWKFVPTSRSYPNVLTNQINQDFSAILVGDVTGNWNPAGPLYPELSGLESVLTKQPDSTEQQVIVTAETNESATEKAALTVNLTATDTTHGALLGYQFDLIYDEQVIEPQEISCDMSDTISRKMTAICHVSESGVLKVVVFGTTPLSSQGTLLKLKFDVIRARGARSALTIKNFMFNEDSPQEVKTD